MAKIIFLGTSGDSSVTARQIRASGGIILQADELQLHIDPGPGALVRAKEFGVNARATNAILVSHNHLNHSHDLNAVIEAMTLGGFDKKGVLIASNSVVNGGEGNSAALGTFAGSCLERIIVVGGGQKTAVEDLEVHAVITAHSDPTSVGFRILAPSFTLGYTGDTAFRKEISVSFEGCDILILNMTFPGNEKSDNHLNREGVIKMVAHIKPKLAILTHFGFEMLRGDPLIEARQIQLSTGIQTISAHDGLSISPATYAAKSGQSRLNKFS
jgi:ribonuclease BN (tRNA processing enzyme)